MHADSSTRTIPLTHGLRAAVDERDHEGLSHWHWYALIGSDGKAYAVRSERRSGRNRTVRMHRQIMLPGPGEVVDHINGDTLDNRRGNLRLCAQAENSRNGKERRNRSGYRGVAWHRHNRKWQAGIRVNRKRLPLGYFDDPVDAALAYDLASLNYHGAFGKTNFLE